MLWLIKVDWTVGENQVRDHFVVEALSGKRAVDQVMDLGKQFGYADPSIASLTAACTSILCIKTETMDRDRKTTDRALTKPTALDTLSELRDFYQEIGRHAPAEALTQALTELERRRPEHEVER